MKFKLNLQLFADPNPGIEPTGGPVEPGAEPTPTPPTEKTFTQSQINEMMKARVNRSHQSFFKRYGVKDLAELDNLIAMAQSYGPTKELYDQLNTEHGELINQHKDIVKKYGYKVHNIDPEKYADIETYFKGKGIDIDENSLLDEIQTHPNWVKKVSTITNLGATYEEPNEKDELEMASQIFGVDLSK